MGLGFDPGFGLGAATLSAAGTVASASFASWPLAGMGAESDWAFVGTALYWGGGFIEYDSNGATNSDTTSLTGAALTAFDAAVSDNTACNLTFSIDYLDDPNVFEVRMKGGSWTPATTTGSSPVIVACTSGSGSGFQLRGANSSSGIIDITDIDVALT